MKSGKMPLREDSCYVGTENIEVKDTQRNLYFEAVLFFLIGTGFLVLFFTRIHSIKGYFKAGGLNSVWGVLIILILSPFGAHLTAKILGFLWEKFKSR